MKMISPNEILHGIKLFQFGRENGTTNWKGLVDDQIGCGAEAKQAMIGSLARALGQARVTNKTILAPNTSSFNAQICTAENLTKPIPSLQGITFLRGCEAEGVLVPQGRAVAFFPADCNTIIARSARGTVIVAHAGGFSLIDTGHMDGGPKRQYQSVVDALVAKFKDSGDLPDSLSAFIVRGVRDSKFGYHPNDRVWGERNRKILALFRAIGQDVVTSDTVGSVDITQAIRLQLKRHGVPEIVADDTNTWNDRDDIGSFKWWSYERALALGNHDEARNCRNLVLVANI